MTKFNVHLVLIQFRLADKSEEDIIKTVQSNCSYSFLVSQGFKDIVFFSISLKPGAKDDFNKIANQNGLTNYDFIFGFNTITNEIYRLKGFDKNDFNTLFNFLAGYYGLGIDFSSCKEFCDHFRVDGLDFECLLEWNKVKWNKKSKKRYFECFRPARRELTAQK